MYNKDQADHVYNRFRVYKEKSEQYGIIFPYDDSDEEDELGEQYDSDDDLPATVPASVTMHSKPLLPPQQLQILDSVTLKSGETGIIRYVGLDNSGILTFLNSKMCFLCFRASNCRN